MQAEANKELPGRRDQPAKWSTTCQVRTILVPTDFSDPAEKALEYATALARQFQAQIVLMHAIEPAFALDCGVPYTDNLESPSLSDRLKKTVTELKAAGVAAAEPVMATGVGWDMIVRTARDVQADLIIIATHGYTGLTHILLGSTAERVVRHAGCPVLVVRERERDFVR
jgi:universal stress protein A